MREIPASRVCFDEPYPEDCIRATISNSAVERHGSPRFHPRVEHGKRVGASVGPMVENLNRQRVLNFLDVFYSGDIDGAPAFVQCKKLGCI
jgi:hypothetical protein